MSSVDLFHGTGAYFTEFRESEDGIFFTSRLETATAYAWTDTGERPGARVMRAHISLQNPLIVDQAYLESFASANHDAVEAAGRAVSYGRGVVSFVENFSASEQWARELVRADARARGADGMIIEEDASPEFHMGGDWTLQQSFVVFSPSQITVIDSRPADRIQDEDAHDQSIERMSA